MKLINKSLKKKFLVLLFIILNFHSNIQADDIRDFQIEGMSVGGILLDYASNIGISIDYLKKEKFAYYPKSKKYVGISITDKGNYKVYDSVQFHIDPNDYKIYSLSGKIHNLFENNKEKCYNKMETVLDEVYTIFSNSEIVKGKEKAHIADKTGKSLTKSYYLKLENGFVKISCSDWSENFKDSNNRLLRDSLTISVTSKILYEWLSNEAY